MTSLKFHTREKESPLLAPACVTAIVLSVTPVPLTVMVAVRASPEFSVAVTVITPLLCPPVGETVHHDSSELAVHAVLPTTSNVLFSPAAAKVKDAGVTSSAFVGFEPNRKSSSW